MTQPVGGSMSQLMAQGDELVDGWVAHAKEFHASTPELLANLLIRLDTEPNKAAVLAVGLATAIQRLAGIE